VVLPLAVLFWLTVAPVTVVRARVPAGCRPGVLALAGVLTLAATWYALAWIFLRHGAVALISLWALIWAADIAAYFTGRALGRHKLAPRVSPGKTREGALGGVIAATAWLVATALWWPDSFGALLLARIGWAGLILAGVVLAAWSIVGDLFESLLKRRAGVKDSSQLLPGHGGVYDRIDAVLPVAPAAVLLLTVL
jgi:phosphatidate cytidylyltransferase